MGTKMLDAELLDSILTKVAKERLMADIHEWIIYTGPPEVVKIYKEYLEQSSAYDIKIDED